MTLRNYGYLPNSGVGQTDSGVYVMVEEGTTFSDQRQIINYLRDKAPIPLNLRLPRDVGLPSVRLTAHGEFKIIFGCATLGNDRKANISEIVDALEVRGIEVVIFEEDD
jgi:hypothetical protein